MDNNKIESPPAADDGTSNWRMYVSGSETNAAAALGPFHLGQPESANGRPVQVFINGQPAQPGDQVKPGDEITLATEEPIDPCCYTNDRPASHTPTQEVVDLLGGAYKTAKDDRR